MKALIFLSLFSVSAPLFAEIAQPSREESSLSTLSSEVAKKQQKALALITLLGAKAQKRSLGNTSNKDEAIEYARVGFVARLQDISEERDHLLKKDALDQASLQNYSKRLDSLITDLHVSLK